MFTAAWLTGEAQLSAELEPFWAATTAVPYDEMWADARLWLPRVLAGGRCDDEYVFASDLSSLNR